MTRLSRFLGARASLVAAAWLALGAGPAATARARADLVDGRGRTVDASAAPQRIASGALASDEVVFELLSRRGELKRLVAVSTLADDAHYSNIAPVPPEIRGRLGGELESLLTLKPDLAILASYNRPETLQRLEAAGIRTWVIGDFTSLSDVTANLKMLGRLIHAEREADDVIAELRAAVAAAAPPAKRSGAAPRLLHAIGGSGGVATGVSGAGTLFDDMARTVGAVNVAAAAGLKGWPQVGAESLVRLAPDWIVVADDDGEKGKARALAALRSSPGWRELAAVRGGKLIVIPERHLVATTQHVAKALAALHAALWGAR